jgi:hypothetical protein
VSSDWEWVVVFVVNPEYPAYLGKTNTAVVIRKGENATKWRMLAQRLQQRFETGDG